ncbi:L-aspartate oxidase [Planococcus shixiaomingii]|uniref:L-aspartate oxidase n=1 Tax=Planococcus shixiaomingii TaxID=3058393 RepID=UPI0026256A47|nr:L-aspartate oxidase [Planococcus sp. N022]WKA53116.1 L-aspartate oxidase [Planococcus sp. N022]
MFDVCIVGGGVAGLMLAHSLPSTLSIAVLTKEDPITSNTALAQGGIAASLCAEDSPAFHAHDTLFAAADHAYAERVESFVYEGQSVVEQLIQEGLPFDAGPDGLPDLGQEGAHSARRILHAGGDQTGKRLMQFLVHHTKGKVTRFPFHQALELIVEGEKCTGVLVSDSKGERKTIGARHMVLATGGIGQLYQQTSNSAVATGDGLSLAFHAGAVLEDLEFVQFHPTVLTLGGKSCGLISEAVRGEGAFLIDAVGQRIMEGIHPLMELAPRDIVARAIERHWQQVGPVYLDATHIAGFEKKFPSINSNCQEHGLDPAEQLLPVRPGAHFHMGGVQTTDSGETSVPGLYAIGETASTGVHGANRLASNSLLEGLVFAKRVATKIQSSPHFPFAFLPVHSAPSKEFRIPENLPQRMTEKIGILRAKEDLQQFIEDYPLRHFQLHDYPDNHIAQIHRYTASCLIATAAHLRTESRGGHYRLDEPAKADKWTGKVIELSLKGTAVSERKIKTEETVQ